MNAYDNFTKFKQAKYYSAGLDAEVIQGKQHNVTQIIRSLLNCYYSYHVKGAID